MDKHRDTPQAAPRPRMVRNYSWGSASSASDSASTSASASSSQARDSSVRRPTQPLAHDRMRPQRHAAADAGQALKRLACLENTPSPARLALKGFVDSRSSLAAGRNRDAAPRRIVSQPQGRREAASDRKSAQGNRKASAPVLARPVAPASDLSSTASGSSTPTERGANEVHEATKKLSRLNVSSTKLQRPMLSSDLSSPPPSPRVARGRKAVGLGEQQGSPLDALMRLCDQCAPVAFTKLLEQLASQVIASKEQSNTNASHRSRFAASSSSAASASGWKKVGEASYSEVFGIGEIVIKVIPLCSETREEEQEEREWPEESKAEDVSREVAIMQACGRGFIRLLSSHVVCGVYPPMLMRAWDAYDKRKAGGSENVRPACLPSSQRYAVLVLEHGGVDVESVKLKGWIQAAAVFWQIAQSLASAEKELRFEHRDLHWGNVLVRIEEAAMNRQVGKGHVSRPLLTTSPSKALVSSPLKRAQLHKAKMSSYSTSKSRRATTTVQNANLPPQMGVVERLLQPATSGATARLIDLSLSRATLASGTIYCAFEDETIFEGGGDEQFDIYRSMRAFIHRANGAEKAKGRGEKARSQAWEAFHPETNLMWCAYMIHKLLKHKGLRSPGFNFGPNPFAAAAVAVTSNSSSSVGSKGAKGAARQVGVQDKEQEIDEALVEAAHASLLRAENKIRASLAMIGAEMQLCTCASSSSTVSKTSEGDVIRSAGDLMRWAAG
ncbi:Serine/threonine kinase (haspin family) [Ceraceosorus bombacis]|uniref:non-specific serine/threonine protein kinase n=1 Tax=Ceraceosorus bombacis TaxID=401625 RepID=A0A0N7LA61_9BASI|nr:Serine/threonine kinase (haspin family) [Ceraceosorus bombacis]